MIFFLASVAVSVASYLMGVQYGKTFSRVEDMKTIKQLLEDCVELRKWKADNIGKEKA